MKSSTLSVTWIVAAAQLRMLQKVVCEYLFNIKQKFTKRFECLEKWELKYNVENKKDTTFRGYLISLRDMHFWRGGLSIHLQWPSEYRTPDFVLSSILMVEPFKIRSRFQMVLDKNVIYATLKWLSHNPAIQIQYHLQTRKLLTIWIPD